MKYKIEVLDHKKTITAEEGSLLGDCLQDSGVPIRFDCNLLGLCGKCAVQILEGYVHSPREEEKIFFSERELEDFLRLSCFFRIKSDLKIKIPKKSIVQEQVILKSGIQIPFRIDPAIKTFLIQVSKPTITSPVSFSELILKGLKNFHLKIPLDILKTIGAIQEENDAVVSAVIHKGRDIISLERGKAPDKCYGFAVDLGTTTLVVELIELAEGRSLDVLAGENPQFRFGADVVTRIGYAVASPKNLKTLQETVIKKLNLMFKEMLSRHSISSSKVYEIALAGNTPMNHILLGLSLQSLAQAPFNAAFSSIDEVPARTVGLDIHPNGKLYLAPNIKSFVGGDISAGLLASGLIYKKGNFLFIDLGTNGEIVLKTEEKIVATSTAAGPAFEGMNISCGMLAIPGAIYRIDKNRDFTIFTVQGKPAKGLCGTGLIDAAALLLNEGLVTSKGQIKDKSKTITITDQISLSQKDIREIQLAVAAVKTGRNMLLKRFSIDPGQLDGIFIAGAFGTYLNVKNGIRIGLLPSLSEEKIHFIGNSSLSGAKALLISSFLRDDIKALIQNIQFVSLASDPEFQDSFIKNLEFPPSST